MFLLYRDMSGCPMPCKVSSYKINYSYSKTASKVLQVLDEGADWILVIFFKNFNYKEEKEYLVCDFTCLVGEVGGNLGFFLGGSILLYINMILDPIVLKLKTN